MSDSPNFINIGAFQPNGVHSQEDFLLPGSFRDDYDSKDPVYLDSGGYGTVFKLKGVASEDIAVKRFNEPFEETNPRKAQFCLRELQILRELKHENIVKMIFAYTPDECFANFNRVYLVTVYCGSTLFDLLKQENSGKQKFNLRSIQNMIYDLLKAIKFLNSANIIHRDLKPDNLAIDENFKLTLLDFGFARVKKILMTDEPGQRFYRSFEAISLKNNEKPAYNEKTDIWSIGAILYEMLTGQILFFEKDEKRRVLKIIEICGPIPDIALNEIEDTNARDYIQKKSLESTRMNFLKQLEQRSKKWLKKEMESYKEQAADFIDRALVYDHRNRMSVDEALAHPFLAQVRQPEKEVTTSQFIADYGDLTLEESKDLIWRLIHQVGPPRSIRPRKVAAQNEELENRKRPCKPVQS